MTLAREPREGVGEQLVALVLQHAGDQSALAKGGPLDHFTRWNVDLVPAQALEEADGRAVDDGSDPGPQNRRLARRAGFAGGVERQTTGVER